jgi:hypothetical protein
MPHCCDLDRIYVGDQSVVRLYAGNILVWPCYTCVELPIEDPRHVFFDYVDDPEYADEFYADAVLYIPKTCAPGIAQKDFAPRIIKDAWPNVELPLGPAYNGLFSVDDNDETFGFNAPISYTFFGQNITEEDSLWLTGFGRDVPCSVSFFITSSEVTLDTDGLLFNVDGLEIYLNGYLFFNPAIKARALRSGLFFPIEIVATESLPNNEETHVIVTYENDDVITRLRIYYDGTMVGEYTV